jgi:hypothetical protein
MTKAERERLVDLWTNTGNTFDLMVHEINKAVRRARREERKRLMTCECGRVCTGPVQCAVCAP